MVNYLSTDGQGGYYYLDYVRILSTVDPPKLRNRLDRKSLKAECNWLSIRTASDAAQKWGYNSSVCCVNPSIIFFYLLDSHQHILCYNGTNKRKQRYYNTKLSNYYNNTKLGYYRISKIDVAKDTLYPTEEEAIESTSRIVGTGYMKYSKCKIISKELTADKRLKGYLWNNSLNLGNRIKYQYGAYARESKINFEPVLHEEFRVCGSPLVRKMMGIYILGDFINYDFQSFFEERKRNDINYGVINYPYLGKWLIDTKRKINVEAGRDKIQEAIDFCSLNDITTFGELSTYFMKEKKSIKKRVGRRTLWNEEMLQLTNYSKFMVPYLI